MTRNGNLASDLGCAHGLRPACLCRDGERCRHGERASQVFLFDSHGLSPFLAHYGFSEYTGQNSSAAGCGFMITEPFNTTFPSKRKALGTSCRKNVAECQGAGTKG